MIEENVLLGTRSYPIYIGRGALDIAKAELAKLVEKKRSIAIVADANVQNLHSEKISALETGAKLIVKNGTESTKTFSHLEDLCSRFAESGMDRKSVVLALGGGVIGDLTGFAAAVYMRGIDFYQAPTTLLAMVDSSVGGKTGINIQEGKNLVGAFHQPQAVFADIDFLATLPPREFSAGMAEVIKCGLLGDEDFFCALEKLSEPLNPNHSYMPEAIRRSCALKAKVVAADERETSASGGRALLNLGHTFGHAIEHCAGYGNYLHGEAVAIGTAMAAELSVRLGTLRQSDANRVRRLLEQYKLPVSLRQPIAPQDLLAAMLRDKKNFSGVLRFVVFEGIGNAQTRQVDASEVLEVLKNYK